MMPPLMTVGSNSPASSKVATSDVVVVLPCVPAMATHCLRRISSASISARRTTGMRCSPRGDELGIVALDRGRNHDDLRRAEIFRVMADMDERALAAQPQDIGVFGRVRALHRIAEVEQNLGNAGHAYAADADEMNGA